RIAIDFASDSIADKLAPLASAAPTTVVMEGVIYYLEPAAAERTLRTLQQLFPRHELVCDLQSDAFVRRWGGSVIQKITEHGAPWRFHPKDPVKAIEALGYRSQSVTSIVRRTAELRRISTPAWVVRWLLPTLRDGFQVCVFSSQPG